MFSISEPAQHKTKVTEEFLEPQYQLLLKRYVLNTYTGQIRAPSVQHFPVNLDYPLFTITFRVKQYSTADEWTTIFNRGDTMHQFLLKHF